MIRIIVIYGQPADLSAFDRYYADVHTPLTQKMPHLAGFEVTQGAVGIGGSAAQAHLVAILSYASRADMVASFDSPEGKAAAADLAKFATGGVQFLTCEMQPVG